MDLKKLAEPFPAADVEWKPTSEEIRNDGKTGVLAYITARAVMDRFDAVCGPENWQVDYHHLAEGVMCTISIRCGAGDEPGGDWVRKSDGAPPTDFEPFKGGISGALKRAAVVWGVGRYLYQLESTRTPARVLKRGEKTPPGWRWTPGFIYEIPALPSWALPEGSGCAPEDPPPESRGEAPEDKGEAGKGRKRGAVLLSGAQMGQIRALQAEIGLSEEELHKGVMHHYGRESLSDLTRAEARGLLERLEARRAAQLKDEAEEAFGGDGRLGKLRAQAMGYCATMERMGMRLVNGEPVRLQNVGLAVESLEELRELLQCAADEKELESVILKLERVLEAMSF